MRIKNWNKHQHFKDRRPPWIKLHRDILDRHDIGMISDKAFRVLVCLWLLASEDETMSGKLPEISDISWRLRMPEKDLTKILQELKNFLIYDDIAAISDCHQSDAPETETYAETETETDILSINAIVDYWNTKDTLPKAVGLSDNRKAKIRTILKDKGLREIWKQSIDRIAMSAWHTGDNPSGWKADFNWWLKPGNVTKMAELEVKQTLRQKLMAAQDFSDL